MVFFYLFFVHFFFCLLMTGVILFVQIVHYPIFSMVTDNHKEFQKFHMEKTTYLVAPLMLGELITGFILLFFIPYGIPPYMLIVNAILIVAIFLATFFLSVPCHEKLLEETWSFQTLKRLVTTNIIRTVFWVFRSFILLAFMFLYKSGFLLT